MQVEMAEIKHCLWARLCYFVTPFSPGKKAGEWENGLNFADARVGSGGHNNTSYNPGSAGCSFVNH